MQPRSPAPGVDHTPSISIDGSPTSSAGSAGWNRRPAPFYRRAPALAFLALILVVPTGLVTSMPSLSSSASHALGAAGTAIEDAARSLADGGGPAGGAAISCSVLSLQATCGPSSSA